jgi:TPR repeat protein
MALATSYDPNELAKLKVIGLQANAAAARKWYDRAAELGAAEAGERLRRLGAR